MPHAVEKVEDEGPRDGGLDDALDGEGHGGEGSDEGGGLDVVADERGDEVEAAVGVERAGEGTARYTGPDGGGEEGLGGVVDLHVGGEGAVEALGGEEVVFLGGGELLGRDGTKDVQVSLVAAGRGEVLAAVWGDGNWECDEDKEDGMGVPRGRGGQGDLGDVLREHGRARRSCKSVSIRDASVPRDRIRGSGPTHHGGGPTLPPSARSCLLSTLRGNFRYNIGPVGGAKRAGIEWRVRSCRVCWEV